MSELGELVKGDDEIQIKKLVKLVAELEEKGATINLIDNED